jgi:glycerol kinase
MNSGEKPIMSSNNLLTTVAWKIGDTVNYALEGSIFVAGSVVQWLRDGLGIIRSAREVEDLATSVPDNGGVYFVPALTGLGAPHWDMHARGTITGLTRGSNVYHIIRAALESIAYQSNDVISSMEADTGVHLSSLKVDGGASANNFLMQFQSDISNVAVVRPQTTEATAQGAAFLAGLAVGFFKNRDELKLIVKNKDGFLPCINQEKREELLAGWANAIEVCKKQ